MAEQHDKKRAVDINDPGCVARALRYLGIGADESRMDFTQEARRDFLNCVSNNFQGFGDANDPSVAQRNWRRLTEKDNKGEWSGSHEYAPSHLHVFWLTLAIKMCGALVVHKFESAMDQMEQAIRCWTQDPASRVTIGAIDPPESEALGWFRRYSALCASGAEVDRRSKAMTLLSKLAAEVPSEGVFNSAR